MTIARPIYRVHAVRRMFERGIAPRDVESVLDAGTVIENYPDDFPHPSRLVLGWIGDRPLHVVAARDATGGDIIVTVYVPDPEEWSPGFRIRRV